MQREPLLQLFSSRWPPHCPLPAAWPDWTVPSAAASTGLRARSGPAAGPEAAAAAASASKSSTVSQSSSFPRISRLEVPRGAYRVGTDRAVDHDRSVLPQGGEDGLDAAATRSPLNSRGAVPDADALAQPDPGAGRQRLALADAVGDRSRLDEVAPGDAGQRDRQRVVDPARRQFSRADQAGEQRQAAAPGTGARIGSSETGLLKPGPSSDQPLENWKEIVPSLWRRALQKS